jgi:glycosyltransferase involved in cell wall biosynthesis
LHQEKGLVVPPQSPQAIADAIYFYYTHRQLAKHHGQLAKIYIQEKFHINRTIKETKALFSLLVNSQE